MRTHSALRAALLCLLPCLAALALPSGPLRAAPAKDKPDEFTDGQSGTPNLPMAPSMIVDKNNMRGGLVADGESIQISAVRVRAFLAAVYPAARNAKGDYEKVRKIVEAEEKAVKRDIAQIHLPEHSLYLGAEARAGADKPVYSPELTYGDTRSGLEFGVAGYLQGAYSEGISRRDSLGVSLKYIPQSSAASTLRDYDKIQKDLLALDKINLNSSRLLNAVTTTSEDLEAINRTHKTNEGKLDAIRQALGITPAGLTAAEAVPGGGVPEVVLDRLKTALQDINADAAQVLGKYVTRTRRPALAFVVGDQSYRSGDIFNGGAVVSRLYPFAEGAPGVTAVAVAQYLHDSFRRRGDRDAGRLGLAAIYQDTTLIYQDKTPKLTTVAAKPAGDPTAPDGTTSAEPPPAKDVTSLGPPWHYKIGLEYTTPLLGLHETGAVFARYRWTPSYVEVTTTYGKDGLRRDYLDISLGKSFTF